MDENVFGYTPPGFAPPYLSANLRDLSGVEITVRSKAPDGQPYGAEAHITLPLDQIEGFIDGLRVARSRLIDEASYADLRASGGIVEAP